MSNSLRSFAEKNKKWIWAPVVGVIVVIFAVISMLSPKIEVPDVTGKSAEEAIAILFEKDLDYKLESSSGDTVRDPAGWEVVSTNPSAGSEVRRGSDIRILVKEIAEESKDAIVSPSDEPTSSATQIAIPDLTGRPGDEANDELKALNLRTDFVSPEGWVLMKSNWDVVSMDPAPGTLVAEGTKVTVTVKSATERLQQESQSRNEQYQKNAADAAALPIEEDYAMSFCDDFTDREYPFGAKNHWIMDKMAAEPRAEGGWYFKVGTTITNAYNAESKMTLECHISGTNGNPVMEQFLVY